MIFVTEENLINLLRKLLQHSRKKKSLEDIKIFSLQK